MQPAPALFCIDCGSRLESEHRFCWSCGAERWQAAGAPAPPPGAGTNPFPKAPPRTPSAADEHAYLRSLSWLFAGGAVLCLYEVVQFAAQITAPHGRAALLAQLTAQGMPKDSQGTLLIVYGVLILGGGLIVAALHGAAYYGLRSRRLWGWVSAVVVSILWSLVLVGIPILVQLLRKRTRIAFGID